MKSSLTEIPVNDMDATQRLAAKNAITGTFIWTFKKGDNIIYNYDIVWSIYQAITREPLSYRMRYYWKPIMVHLAAIIECIFEDFSNRIQQRVSDPLPNISPEVIADFKLKNRDKFETYITAMQKHNLLHAGARTYAELQLLRKVRNRMHIQNAHYQPPLDESALFNQTALVNAEICFEIVILRMMELYPRSTTSGETFSNFPVPWQKHI